MGDLKLNQRFAQLTGEPEGKWTAEGLLDDLLDRYEDLQAERNTMRLERDRAFNRMEHDALLRIEAEQERGHWIETARQYALNSDYYRGLVVKVGEMLGHESYVADDGGVHLDVLCAKVPEMVVALKAEAEKVKEDLRFANNELVLADKQNEELLAERDRLEAEAGAMRQALIPVADWALVGMNKQYRPFTLGQIRSMLGDLAVKAMSGTAGAELLKERTEDKARIGELEAFVDHIAVPGIPFSDKLGPAESIALGTIDTASMGLIRHARRLLGRDEETGE